jgi:hypothetical protein
MIVTKLQGGLGNQLFQWATTENLSIKYNCDIFFDKSYFQSSANSLVTQWNYELDKFDNIKIKETDGSNLNKIYDNFIFTEIHNNSYLDGYWQSEKYFLENQEFIKNKLKIKDSFVNHIYEKYPILQENTVSLHVRRGDYLNIQDHHPVQTIEYYNNCIEELNENNINIMVFSNDIDWCIDNLKYKNITYVLNQTNVDDLYTMSLCRHNIIANSSFSWWGAWLNRNQNKKVIAPKKWFGINNIHIDTKDLLPKSWIKL